MNSSGNEGVHPKSMRHKQILDVAAERPDATMDEIASEVPSATTDLVERVFEEYSDPARDGIDDPTAEVAQPTDGSGNGSDESTTDDSPGAVNGMDEEIRSAGERSTERETTSDDRSGAPTEQDDASGGGSGESSETGTEAGAYPPPEALSEKQLETLRMIADHPEAPQRELADQLGVTAATVSRRMNTIDWFEWRDREAFAEAVLPDDETAGSSPDGGTDASDDPSGNPSDAMSGSTADWPALRTAADDESSGDDAPSDVATGEDLAALETSVDRLAERVADLEAELDEDRTGDTFENVELASKLIRACVDSPDISREEELRILKALLS